MSSSSYHAGSKKTKHEFDSNQNAITQTISRQQRASKSTTPARYWDGKRSDSLVKYGAQTETDVESDVEYHAASKARKKKYKTGGRSNSIVAATNAQTKSNHAISLYGEESDSEFYSSRTHKSRGKSSHGRARTSGNATDTSIILLHVEESDSELDHRKSRRPVSKTSAGSRGTSTYSGSSSLLRRGTQRGETRKQPELVRHESNLGKRYEKQELEVKICSADETDAYESDVVRDRSNHRIPIIPDVYTKVPRAGSSYSDPPRRKPVANQAGPQKAPDCKVTHKGLSKPPESSSLPHRQYREDPLRPKYAQEGRFVREESSKKAKKGKGKLETFGKVLRLFGR